MKKIIYVDMDDVLCDYSTAHQEALQKKPGIRFPQSQYGFYKNLNPIKDGIKTVEYLMLQDIFEIYILTAPSVKNPLCYTEKRIWIENHFGFEMVNRLIISPNKGLNKGDYLIDDNSSGKGQENFDGEVLKFGSEEFRDWEVVLGYFREKYNLSYVW